jgi:hypothetical protein
MFNMLGVFMLFLMIQMWLREAINTAPQTEKESRPTAQSQGISVITRDKAC